MKYFLFDKAQKYVTRINTEYLIEAHYTEEINTAGQLEFTLPATMRLPKNVFYVCVTDPNDETSYLMFKIITEKVTDEQVTYTCIENAYDELASYTYIQDKRPTAIASAMLQMALDGTRWSVGSCPEVSPKFCSFYYISVLEAIQKIVNLWGFEVQFQVKIDGITNEIKQRNVNMYTKLGERTNKRFEYGSNLLSVTQANDSTGLYTALVGRGKGVQVSEGDTDTDPDGYGRRITFADVVWSTQSGNPLNKPAGQEYLEDPNATAAYGFPDGHPRIGFVVFQDCEDPNELIQLTYNKLQEVNHPQVQFSASITDVGSLNLGDTIAIIRHDIGIEYYTRVFKVVHDLLDSSNNTVELGDNISGSNSITQQISTIQNNQSNVQNAIDTIVMNGADGNKLFFGTEFPANGTDGDIFYKTLENGGTEMYIYKDGGWQLVVSTEELGTVQKKVDEQTSQIQQAVDSANSAVSKADEAVAQVGTLDENVKNLDAESKQNQNDIAQAKSDLLQTKSDLDAAKANISAAQADIQADKQSIQNLSAEAQQQGQTIVNIQKTQSGLAADIADVKGNVSSLQDTANGLQATVADNKNNISSLKQTAQGLESTVSNMRVGGTNLLRNTKMMNGLYWFSQQSPIQSYYQGIGVIHVTSDWWNARYNYPSLVTDGIPNNTNDVFTFSCLVKKSDKNSSGNISFFCGAVNVLSTHIDQSAINTDYWTQIWVTFKFKPSSEINLNDNYGNSMRFEQGESKGTMLYTMFKLEKGSIPTAYSPSPQDTAESISTISQKADEIAATVTSNTGDISQLKQTTNSLQSSVTDNSNNISSLKQTANSLQSTITQGIGAYLPNGDFDDKVISKYWAPWDTTKDLSEISVGDTNRPDLPNVPQHYLRIATKSSENKTDIVTKAFIPINVNEGIQIKAWSYLGASQGNTQFQFYIHCYDKNNNEIDSWNYYFKYDNLKEWEQTDVSWGSDVWNKDTVSIRLEIVLFGGGIDTYGAITGLKIINGSSGIASQFTQTIDSLTSKIADADGNISQLKQTSDSLTSQIGNANNDISSLKQHADSMESNISDNKNDISQLKQTASSLQSVVSTKADLSQVTQMGNVIQSVVRSVGTIFPNGDFSSSDIQSFWQPWDTTHDYANIKYDKATYNGSYGNLLLHSANGAFTKAISSDFIPVSPSNNVTISVDSRADWYGSNQEPQLLKCYVHFYNSQKQETSSGSLDLFKSNNQNWGSNQVNYGTSEDECFIRIEFALQGNSEGYAHLTNVKAICGGGENVSSKISQLANDINLRVQKGDLLSQINIEAGQTLIQSDKLYLDASSVVFSGNAFIPSAAITDLSADKITTGTLNAANVHVINMDVANLVGDTTSFVRSQWQNAYGSYVNIESSGMSVGYGNWFTKFDSLGMAFTDSGDDLGGFTRIGMQGAPSWYGGLAFNAGGDAEFLSIGAKDYHNDNQNPIPSKLLWARQGIDTYGYNPGWNFGDDVWTDKIGINSIQYGSWNIHFGIVVGSNNFSALTLTSGSGNGFYWGSDGSFGYVTGGNVLHNVKGSQIVYSIGSDGICHSWGGV